MEQPNYKKLAIGLSIVVLGFVLIGVGIWLTGTLSGSTAIGGAATVAAVKKAIG
jgi:hypothetical protein